MTRAEQLTQEREQLLAEARTILERSADVLSDDDQARFDAITGRVDQLADDIARHRQIEEATQRPGWQELPAGFNVNRRGGDPWRADTPARPDEMRGRALDALERLDLPAEQADRAARIVDGDSEFAARMYAASDPAYARAFAKLLRDPVTGHNAMTNDETAAWERAVVVGTNNQGGYMVPTFLDPTIILSNAGSNNALRQIARVVTLTTGNIWHGVSSAGVTASFDAEASEVSDDSPSLAGPSISTFMARAFVPYTIEASQDIDNLSMELSRIFADSKDVLEGSKFNNGSGNGEPKGLWTAIAATTACRVVSTTAATIGLVDLQSTYKAVPQRFRTSSTWYTNPTYALTVQALGTALSASYTANLTEAPSDRLIGRPVVQSDDCPVTQTTTALDSEVMLGDFSEFVIVDRAGLSIEFIPHLFSTGNGRPTGSRGLFAYWRTGSDVVVTSAFTLLVDKTSA
jgi:HK97 family phage major capsid protein